MIKQIVSGRTPALILHLLNDDKETIKQFWHVGRQLIGKVELVPVRLNKRSLQPAEEQLIITGKIDREFLSQPRLFIFQRQLEPIWHRYSYPLEVKQMDPASVVAWFEQWQAG